MWNYSLLIFFTKIVSLLKPFSINMHTCICTYLYGYIVSYTGTYFLLIFFFGYKKVKLKKISNKKNYNLFYQILVAAAGWLIGINCNNISEFSSSSKKYSFSTIEFFAMTKKSLQLSNTNLYIFIINLWTLKKKTDWKWDYVRKWLFTLWHGIFFGTQIFNIITFFWRNFNFYYVV